MRLDAYLFRSISRASSTAGVIHPPQILSRGNTCLSRIMVSRPDRRSSHAQDEPAGPPPTIRTSHESISVPLLLATNLYKGERESKGSADIPIPQKRFETIVAFPPERQRSIRRDRGATLEQIPIQTFYEPGPLNLQICSTNAPGF